MSAKKTRVLRTGDEMRAIDRDNKNLVYRKKHPHVKVRDVTKDYISKKDALAEGEDSTQLLENMLLRIRGIFTEESGAKNE